MAPVDLLTYMLLKTHTNLKASMAVTFKAHQLLATAWGFFWWSE